MKKQKFRDQGTFEALSSDMEHPTGVSMTVPDEAMSMSEILKRFAVGLLDSSIIKEGSYSDTDDPDDHNPVVEDITDLQDVQDEIELLSKEQKVDRPPDASGANVESADVSGQAAQPDDLILKK